MNRGQIHSCYFQLKLLPFSGRIIALPGFPFLVEWYYHPLINSASHLWKLLLHFGLPLPEPSIGCQTLLILSPKHPPVSAPSFKSQLFNSGLVTSCLEHCKILLTALTHSIIHKPAAGACL